MSKKTGFSSIIFLFLISFAFSQVPQSEIKVEISKEKTTVNGKTFYLHTVKEGENIYRISLAYGVKQKDIIIANPEAISGNIKAGQVLKIPTEPANIKSIQNIESDNFIYHITEEQQTVFSITQKYSISKEELYKYNPELEFSPLQVGQVVRVPKKQNVSQGAETFRPIDNYVDHKVRRKETKYSISKEYGITVDELIAANPVLNTEDLKSGTTIKIPVKSEVQISTASLLAKRDSIVALNTLKTSDTLKVIPCDSSYMPYSGNFEIALLLPFSIEDNETRAKLDSAASVKNHDHQVNTELLPRSVFSLEFYEGFLIALDSLKAAGLNVKIHTYDTGKDLARLKKIISKPEMLKMDLIIGPFFNEGIETVNQFSVDNKIKLVSPMMYNDTVSYNPYSFQIVPGEKSSLEFMIQSISTFQKKNFILVLNPTVGEKSLNDIYKQCLTDKLGQSYKIFDNPTKLPNLTNMLKEDSVENIIFIPSSDETFIIPLFSRLSLDSKKYNIKVYGVPACSRLRNVDQEYFHNLQFHFYTPFYADYQTYKIKKFIQVFRKKYKFEPQEFQKEGMNFAFVGYDLGTYFLHALGKNGKNFISCLDNNKVLFLHSEFKFEKEFPNGGFVNMGLQLMKFTRDNTIEKVN